MKTYNEFNEPQLTESDIGGKARGRKFSFKTPEDLKKKLENMLKKL